MRFSAAHCLLRVDTSQCAFLVGHEPYAISAGRDSALFACGKDWKSLFFLFVPPELETGLLLGHLHYEQLFYLYGAISLVLGAYLTYGGFTSRAS